VFFVTAGFANNAKASEDAETALKTTSIQKPSHQPSRMATLFRQMTTLEA
jgi:hypothetical protein